MSNFCQLQNLNHCLYELCQTFNNVVVYESRKSVFQIIISSFGQFFFNYKLKSILLIKSILKLNQNKKSNQINQINNQSVPTNNVKLVNVVVYTTVSTNYVKHLSMMYSLVSINYVKLLTMLVQCHYSLWFKNVCRYNFYFFIFKPL